ncbi:MAG: polysaccharide pyruvyl transferase family protein [Eubacteriales bacterium]
MEVSEKMKIGILSMQTVNNYGSVLQAYSLKQIVSEIIDADIDFIPPDYNDAISIKMPVQDAGDYESEPYLVSGKLDYFVKKFVNKLKIRKFNNQIKKFQIEVLHTETETSTLEYDVVIEGSDEVFKATRLFSFYMYGGIPNAKKLMTYAAASGSAVYEGLPRHEMENIKKSMMNFSAMSVRDNATEQYIRKIYSGNIERNMDPVLMGNLSERAHGKVKYDHYLVVYAYRDRIRTKDEISEIKRFADENRLKIVALGAPQYWCDLFLPVSPFEVLDYFYYAEYVITDTFHGAVFSIINHCNFAVILRNSNRNKLEGLMEELKLQDRIVTNPCELKNILSVPPAYEAVDEIMNRERIRTREYLRNNLE